MLGLFKNNNAHCDWKIAHLQVVRGQSFWTFCDRVTAHCCTEKFCTRHYTKELKLSSEHVEGLVRVSEAVMLNS